MTGATLALKPNRQFGACHGGRKTWNEDKQNNRVVELKVRALELFVCSFNHNEVCGGCEKAFRNNLVFGGIFSFPLISRVRCED